MISRTVEEHVVRMGINGLTSALVLGTVAAAIGMAPSATADTPNPPGLSVVDAPVRHQTPGDVEINSSRSVEFPRQYPNFLDRGVYHHGHHG
jgi:hypothetical protein